MNKDDWYTFYASYVGQGYSVWKDKTARRGFARLLCKLIGGLRFKSFIDHMESKSK